MDKAIPKAATELSGKAPVTGSYIYFLLRDGVCVYVGQTTCLRRRISSHKHDTSKQYDRVLYMHVEDDVRLEMERTFIKRLEPEHNRQIGRPKTTGTQPIREVGRWSDEDWSLVQRAARRLGGTVPDFARPVLLAAARRALSREV